jgi:hypothetical protein
LEAWLQIHQVLLHYVAYDANMSVNNLVIDKAGLLSKGMGNVGPA